MKKMIIVSPETHSSLFLIKGKIQQYRGNKNITLNDVMKVLISHYYKLDRINFPPDGSFKLEEKE